MAGVMERPAFRAVSQGLFPGFLSLVLMTPVSGLPPLPLCLPPLFALPGLRNLRACPSLCRLRGGSGARTLVRGGLPRPSWPRGPPLRPRDLVSGHLPAEGAGPAGRSLKSGILVGVGAPLAPRVAFATAGSGFWASAGRRALARPAGA